MVLGWSRDGRQGRTAGYNPISDDYEADKASIDVDSRKHMDSFASLEDAQISSGSTSASAWLSRHIGVVTMTNIILFCTSVLLFAVLPFRDPGGLNHALKQVSTYCTFTF